MKRLTNKLTLLVLGGIAIGAAISMQSCSKNNNSGTPPPSGPTSSSDSVEPNNLVLYWNFDNTMNEQKLGLTPSTSTGVTYISGVRGQAYQGGSGVSATFSIPASDSTTLLKLGSYSLSFWYYMAAQQPSSPTNDPGGIFFMGGSNPNDWNELIYEIEPYAPVSGDSVRVHNGFNNIGLAQTTPTAYTTFVMQAWDTSGVGKWVNIVTTYDGPSSTYIVYENGTPIQNQSAWGYLTTNIIYQGNPSTVLEGPVSWTPDPPASITIGAWPASNTYGVSTANGNSCFNGALDELRIWDTALSVQDVADLYQDGKAGK